MDGVETRIDPVDVARRGGAVPVGEHETLCRYRPLSILLAVWASLVAYRFAPLRLILKNFFSRDK